MKILKCPNCGAKISYETKTCEYCGTNFQSNNLIDSEFTKSNENKEINEPAPVLNEPKPMDTSSFNTLIISLILLVFCWPIGLFYIFSRANKKHKTK